jgi:tetratricopeptide (TPR) repeat protein
MESINKKLLRQGFIHLNSGNLNSSVEIGVKLLNLDPSDIEATILLGLAYYKQKKYENSINYLHHAAIKKPFDKAIRIFYIENLIKIDKFQEALVIIENSNKLIDQELRIILKSTVLEKLGRFSEVIDELKMLTSNKFNLKKNELLAWNYELINNVNKAKFAAKAGLQIEIKNFKCNIVLVKCYLRKQKLKKVKKHLKQIDTSKISKVNFSIYYTLKGQYFEKIKKYNKAFNNYTKANLKLIETDEYKFLKGNNYYTKEVLERIKSYYSGYPKYNLLIPSEEKIVFMLGFPRSGTTLLENILKTHSKIKTIEEKPTLDGLLSYIFNKNNNIEDITNFDKKTLDKLQAQYIIDRNKFTDTNKKLIIDKLPLNLMHIGFIYRIFPNAKFILSIRDIRDVALSCYFQSFKINDAMANFLNWENTCNYLTSLILTGLDIIEKYPINIILVEYEELVKNPFKLTAEIIEFLGLEWENSMFNYRKKIKGRNINTPSYSMVNNKITTQQTQKWKNYKSHVDIIDVETIRTRLNTIFKNRKVLVG